MAVGALATHFKFISEQGRKDLTDLMVNIFLPAQVINGFVGNIGSFNGGSAILIFALSTMIQVSMLLLNLFLYRDLPAPKRAVMRYAMAVPNSAFIGVPLVASVLGDIGLVYGSLFVIPVRINCFSIAINYFTSSHEENVIKKIVTQPTIVATFLGIIIMIVGWHPPIFVMDVVSSISACATPICMIVIGAVLYSFADVKKIEPLIIRYTFVRLIVLPLVAFLVFRLLTAERALVATAVLMTAMPAGSTTGLLADKYGADAALAGKLILVSTIASIFTLPIWSYLCLYV